MIIGALTGDIVRSQRMSAAALDAIFHSMQGAADGLAAQSGQASLFTRMRGDGWQMICTPALTLRTVLVMRAAVRASGKGYETRLGVSVGPATTRGTDLSNADGKALVDAGQALDTMKKSQRIVGPSVPHALRPSLPLAEIASSRWTQRQAEVCLRALALPIVPREAIATELGVTQQTLQDHWSSAGLSALLEACTLFEALPETG